MPLEIEDNRPPRVARSMYKKFSMAALALVFFTAAPIATAFLMEVDNAAQILDEFGSPIREVDKNALDDVEPGKPQTLVLIGSDRRFGDKKAGIPPRSDTLLLARLDPDQDATAVMSIPRDLKVQIPGVGMRKMNEAYSEGGAALVIETLKELLGEDLSINHFVTVNFGGFARAVNRLGCIYADIDRRYFNDNSPPAGGGEPYAVIDVPAGYSRLCGQSALQYVRFRHLDNDLVRAARQQDFLRNAKEQVGLSGVFGDRDELLRIFARYTETDIGGTKGILGLLKLAFEATKNPIQEIQFPAEDAADGSTFLEIGDTALRKTVDRFLDARASPSPRRGQKKSSEDRQRERSQKRRRRTNVAERTFLNPRPPEDLGIRLGVKVDFPVYYPRLTALGGELETDDSRAYTIYAKGQPNKKYTAYRMVFEAPGTGQYYGVQGMSWKNPPILDNPSQTRTINGRKYRLYFDGERLRVVAWMTDNGVYWVSNTLNRSLRNAQMLGIAESLAQVGS